MRRVSCESCALRAHAGFRPQRETERRFIAAAKSRHLVRPANETIYAPDQEGVPLYTLYSGWAFRYASLSDGSRQIVEFLLPGDLVGLPAIFLDRMTYGAEALTRVELCELAGQPLDRLFTDLPELSRALVQSLIEDRQRADYRLAMLGRRQGPQRIAYIMLECLERLQRRGLVADGRCPMPLRRRHWADAAGLSGTHVNRSLDLLRARGLALLEQDVLTIPDWAALASFAGYEPLDRHATRLLI